MTSLKTSIKTITYLSDIGCLEIQGASLPTITQDSFEKGIVFSAGAFVSSIVAVRIGIWLYHRSDNPRELIPGRKDDGNA